MSKCVSEIVIDGIKYVPVNSAMVLHTQIKEALKICGSNQ